MPPSPRSLHSWLPLGLLVFLAGMLTFSAASGLLTGRLEREQAAARESAFTAGQEAGYAQGRQEGAAVAVQQADINLFAAQTFFEVLQVELKAISRNTNAIDFVYGEHSRARHREPALDVGNAIAFRADNRWYIIKHQAVSANLQRATVEVTRLTLPIAGL